MAYIDYERAWVKLKAEIASKGSHGKRDLLARIVEIEVECATDDPRYDPSPVRRLGSSGRGAA